MPTPMELLQYQVDHYADLLKNARSIKHRMFVRRELYNLKQKLQSS